MFSWFKKKQQPAPKVNLAHLPALNAWGVFFQGNGFNLYSRYAGEQPGTTSQYVYLKSYPEVYQLERALFADWLFIAFAKESEGVFLQRIDNDGVTLVFIRLNDQNIRIIKTGLTGVHSAVLTNSTTVTFTHKDNFFTIDSALSPEQ